MNAPPAYDLLALDLDGTLVVDSNPVTPRVRAAIRQAQARGVHVTLATGRMFQSARRFAQDLGVTVPIICYQGALIRHPQTGASLYARVMPVAPARQVLAFAAERGLHINAYVDDELYMRQITPEGEFYASTARVDIHVAHDLDALVARGTTKLVIVTDEDQVLPVVAALQARLGSALFITRSHPRFAEATSPDVSKGAALHILAKRLGIPVARTMAIGDNLNDLDLVQAAGLGVAMGDGDQRVRAAAGWVTGTYFEDGVATAIEKFILAPAGAA
ncbi:MAG: HAD family phosphatase [Actinobacteria bacterium]|nr:HAD family phosphatase [Actinomycetota bacterium]